MGHWPPHILHPGQTLWCLQAGPDIFDLTWSRFGFLTVERSAILGWVLGPDCCGDVELPEHAIVSGCRDLAQARLHVRDEFQSIQGPL